MAIVCAVGDGLQHDPTFVGHLLEARRRRAAPHGVAGGGAPEHHARDSRGATSSRRSGACTSGSSARRVPRVSAMLLLIGHGRMGQLVEQLAPAHGCEIAGVVDETSAPRRCSARDFGEVDVAIDFSRPAAVPANLRALAARGINVVIGTTGWQARRGASARAIAERAGIGVLAAANFSLGMNVFRLVVEEAARRFARAAPTSARGFTKRITRPRRTRRRARR